MGHNGINTIAEAKPSSDSTYPNSSGINKKTRKPNQNDKTEHEWKRLSKLKSKSKSKDNRMKILQLEGLKLPASDYANLGNFIYKRKKGEKGNEKKKDVEGLFLRTIDQSAGGKLRGLNAEESWSLLEDLALCDNEG
ncbi:hypothetical protein Tco_0352083 [Tanacetum coccineum]